MVGQLLGLVVGLHHRLVVLALHYRGILLRFALDDGFLEHRCGDSFLLVVTDGLPGGVDHLAGGDHRLGLLHLKHVTGRQVLGFDGIGVVGPDQQAG